MDSRIVCRLIAIMVGCASAPTSTLSPSTNIVDQEPQELKSETEPVGPFGEFKIDPLLQEEIDRGQARVMKTGNCDGVLTRSAQGLAVCIHRAVHDYWTRHKGAICLGRPFYSSIVVKCECGATEIVQYFENMVRSGGSGAVVLAIEADEYQRNHRELMGHDHQNGGAIRSCYCLSGTIDEHGQCVKSE